MPTVVQFSLSYLIIMADIVLHPIEMYSLTSLRVEREKKNGELEVILHGGQGLCGTVWNHADRGKTGEHCRRRVAPSESNSSELKI